MPFGTGLTQKTSNWNRRYGLLGLPLDNYIVDLQFAYSINNQLLSSYKDNIIEVIEDDGGTTQEFKASPSLQSEILSFVGENNGYIVGIYDQITGVKTVISTGSQQIQIVNAGVFVNYTNKYSLEIPQNTLLTVSGIAACNRIKDLNLANYIAFKGEKIVTGYSNDYVYPINCNAGLMDFSITSGTNVFWYDADGGTSTANNPSPTLVNAGISYMFATNMLADLIIQSKTTGSRYVGTLKDIPRFSYKLLLNNCSNMTGDLADLQGNITNNLSIASCSNITGDLADLQGNITYAIDFKNCILITGDLADLQGKITTYLDLSGCTNINGVYTPIGIGTPTTFIVANTGLSANDVDNTLIACYNNPKNSVTFTWTGLSRTAASNVAATALDTTYNWTFSPAL